MTAKESLGDLLSDAYPPVMHEALRTGYRLGLLAAIEEIERTALPLPDGLRSDLLKLAVRVRSRLADLALNESHHVRPRPP